MTPIRDEFDRWLEETAPSLRQRWDTPELWPRIAGSLEEERGRANRPATRSWMAAVAALVILIAPVAWLLRTSHVERRALLTEQALEEVRDAEQAYAKSIDRLSQLAAPRLENPQSPIISSYREKLMVIDDAIAALKIEAGRNPYNDHLRRELLALYQDKQNTLKGILDESSSHTATP